MTDAVTYAELLNVCRHLAVDDPITHSYEGLDDRCLWCGADARCGSSGSTHADHYADCAWVFARRTLNLTLGAHTVRAETWADADAREAAELAAWKESPSYDAKPVPLHRLLPPVRAPRGGIRYRPHG